MDVTFEKLFKLTKFKAPDFASQSWPPYSKTPLPPSSSAPGQPSASTPATRSGQRSQPTSYYASRHGKYSNQSRNTERTLPSAVNTLVADIEYRAVPARSGAQFALDDLFDDDYGAEPRKLTDQVKAAQIRRDQDGWVLEKVKEHKERNWIHSRYPTWFPIWPWHHMLKNEAPSQKELISVVNNAFTPRMEIPVLVCDIMSDYALWQTVRLGDIENCKSSSQTSRFKTYTFRLAGKAGRRHRAMAVSESHHITVSSGNINNDFEKATHLWDKGFSTR
jgi:hypothetical protein